MNPSEFGLDDYREQLVRMVKMPSWKDTIGRLPGFWTLRHHINRRAHKREIGAIDRILASMTTEERRDPSTIGSTRKQEIAEAAGVFPGDVTILFWKFGMIRKTVENMIAMGWIEQLRMVFGDDVQLPPQPQVETDPRHSDPLKMSILANYHARRALLRRAKGVFGEWDIHARAGRPAPEHEPLFSHWKKDLMLWSFSTND